MAFDPDRTPPRQHKRGKKRSLNGNYPDAFATSPIMHSTIPVGMTIVCIDIHERIFVRESQSERTALLSSDIVASGLD